MSTFEVDVIGLPAPKGSKTAFIVGGRAIVTDKAPMNRAKDKLSPWKLAVTAAVQARIIALGHPSPLDAPLAVRVQFWLPKPESASKRVLYPMRKPDLDKLARAALDLCSKSVWTDDARIVSLTLEKRFANGRPPGMTLAVWEEHAL